MNSLCTKILILLHYPNSKIEERAILTLHALVYIYAPNKYDGTRFVKDNCHQIVLLIIFLIIC